MTERERKPIKGEEEFEIAFSKHMKKMHDPELDYQGGSRRDDFRGGYEARDKDITDLKARVGEL